MPSIRALFRRFSRPRIALVLVGLVLLFAGLAYTPLFGELPAPDTLLSHSSRDATKIYDRNGRLLFEILDPRSGRRTRVPLDELPANFQNAVIAVEDSNFYQHPGIDVTGIARALIQDLEAGRVVAGGSTITQQLARDLLMTREESESRTLLRKLREAVLAVRLTQAYSKQTILELYLNETYFGNLAYGAEAAAETYFAKPARELDLAESALLAGIVQSPTAYNPLVNLDAARARQHVVLDLMVKRGYITENETELAYAEALHFKPNQNTTLRAPHFVTFVRNLLEEEYGAEKVNSGGLRVITTLDLDLQERAEDIVKQNLNELVRRTREEAAPDYNLHDAALVAVRPSTGEILAMVGSADYADESIDGAVNVALSNRQPGSAIKAITYATAFSRDLSPASVMSDVPTTFQTKEHEPYAPENYDRTWHGPISLRTALATSSNMVAVKVLDHVGLDAMIATAKSLGISTFNDSDRFGLALTLGGGEVKLLDLTAAYAAFANQGLRVEPRAILTVTEDDGQMPEGAALAAAIRAPAVRAVSPQVAYLITNVLSDDKARIPAFGENSVLELSRPAAAKTGTTTDFRDNWTVGYTPDLAVGVWAGNADNSPMYKISGITGAAPIWHDFMEEALAAVPQHGFIRPEGIVDVDVCETSGLLATPDCPRVRGEVFINGTEPLAKDDSYRALRVDAATGLAWANGCSGHAVERVYRLFPPDAQDWARRQGFPEPPEETCLGTRVALLTPANTAPLAPPNQGEELTYSPPDQERTEQSSQKGTEGGALVVTDPPQNSTFQLSPQLPPELQQIEIAARPGSVTALAEVKLLVDGQVVATFSAAPYRLLWRLAPGTHQVQAIATTENGTRATSEVLTFVVTSAQP